MEVRNQFKPLQFNFHDPKKSARTQLKSPTIPLSKGRVLARSQCTSPKSSGLPSTFSRTPKGCRSLAGTPKSSCSKRKLRKENRVEDCVTSMEDPQYKDHLFQTYLALKFIRTLPKSPSAQLKAQMKNLLNRTPHRRTVIFDLDETLVHCVNPANNMVPSVVLDIKLPNGELAKAGINVRPFARECLLQANNYFEVIVFTASHKCYADVVLDYLDPTGELIKHRLYRDDCILHEGVYIKDLRVLANRSLNDLIIVDNAVYSFGYQLDNGIPILSWKDDPNDKELFNLIGYLKALARCPDMLKLNRKTFKLRRFYSNFIKKGRRVK